MIVERDARADDIEKRRTAMRDCGLDQRHELLLVAGKSTRDIRRAELQRESDEIDRRIAVDDAFLRHRALIRGRRKLAFGEAVHAVILDDVDHVHAAPDRVNELADADRRRVAVARNAEINQIAIGEIRTGQHRGHASVHSVEAMRLAEKIIRRLRAAADAGKFGDTMRFDVELQHAWMIAAEIESWPQPAHSVEILPS